MRSSRRCGRFATVRGEAPALDPDRKLALAYVPAARRPAIDALWRLDVTLGGVLATGREPKVSRIRLAWWREALERLDQASPPPEPVLAGVAAHVLPCGLTGAQLAKMEEGWLVLLEPEVGMADLDFYADMRGGLLFRFSALLLGEDGEVDAAGARWALIDLARRCAGVEDRQAAFAAARTRSSVDRWPKRLRPLGMLDRLAGRDLKRGPDAVEKQGAPARMLRMLRHRLTGR